MKVVQVGPFPPPHGGVETNLVAIRDYLRANGIASFVINITRHKKKEADQVFYPVGALELIWDLFRGGYDVVHLHVGGRIPVRVQALALVCACVPGARSVLTLHSGGFPSSPEGKAAGRASLLGFVLRRFTRLIGVNREILEFYTRLGVHPKRTKLILPHAVSLATIAESLPEPIAAFYAERHPVLISVSGFEPEYDIPNQLEAMGQVLKQYPNAGLFVAGKGSLEAEIRARISSKPYADRILMCTNVPHAAILRAIDDSDILLRTTLYDGDAISVREALFLGTPVIATDNGMRPLGLDLIPMGDPAALAEAIDKRLQVGKAGTPAREADEGNLAAVLDLYRDALGQSAS